MLYEVITTVAEGACVTYTGTYYPSEANDTNGQPTTCPSAVVFKDTVEATAIDIFGAPVTPHTDMAECKLCPRITSYNVCYTKLLRWC